MLWVAAIHSEVHSILPYLGTSGPGTARNSDLSVTQNTTQICHTCVLYIHLVNEFTLIGHNTIQNTTWMYQNMTKCWLASVT